MLRGVDNNAGGLPESQVPKHVRDSADPLDEGCPMASVTPFDDYYDLVEAARELAIHPQSLRRLIKQNKIPATMFAGKYLIARDKLEMFKSNYDPRPGRKPIRRLL